MLLRSWRIYCAHDRHRYRAQVDRPSPPPLDVVARRGGRPHRRYRGRGRGRGRPPPPARSSAVAPQRPRSEIRAADIDDRFTLADYLEREERTFDEVRTRVEDVLPAAGQYVVNRYVRTSRSSPSRLDRDYNRTFEVEPDTLRGGALLIHGLTDSPYSMKTIAEHLTGRRLLFARAADARTRHRAGGARHERGRRIGMRPSARRASRPRPGSAPDCRSSSSATRTAARS